VSAPRRTVVGLALAVAGCLGCGYRPLAAHGAGEQRLSVVAGARTVPAARAHDALVVATAGRLAEAGELAGGAGYPRLEVELVRIDETAEALAPSGERPLARGLRITATGRARVLRGPSEEPAFDTGDMSAHAFVSAGGAGTAGSAASPLALRDEAAALAARALGRRLAERVLGLPSPSDEGRGADL